MSDHKQHTQDNYVSNNRKLERFLHQHFSFLYKGFNPRYIEINQIDMPLPRLPVAFDGYRVLQISDIHIGTWMTPERLSGIISLVNQQEPGLIVNTGDYFSYDPHTWKEILTKELRKLNATDGVVSVLGNHDYWVGADTVKEIMKDSGTIDITNQVFTITRGKSNLHIAGGDCAYVDRFSLQPLLPKIPQDECAIILVHEPDTADQSAASGSFDLQLSGHSHGGQMILPFYGPALRIRLARKYTVGLHHIGEMKQYTNRGLGTALIPLRINCKPEITVFTLKSMN